MLTFANVSKTYRLDHQKITALHDISLEIHEGEFVAVLGPSGSGKSTLLHLMGGLDVPTSGNIFFGNKNLAHINDHELSSFRNKHVGFVFQDSLLLPHLTLLENVELPKTWDASRKTWDAENLLKEVGLERFAKHKQSELSGGQKQRACIARSLIMRPMLLLADEPTGNLDTKTGKEIIELFKRLHAEHRVSFVIATHDDEIAKAASRILYIKDGRIK